MIYIGAEREREGGEEGSPKIREDERLDGDARTSRQRPGTDIFISRHHLCFRTSLVI